LSEPARNLEKSLGSFKFATSNKLHYQPSFWPPFFCHLADGHAGNARQANSRNIDRKMNGIKINIFCQVSRL